MVKPVYVALCVAALAGQGLAAHRDDSYPNMLIQPGPEDACPPGQALDVFDRAFGSAAPPSTLSLECYPQPYGIHVLDSQYLIRMDSPGEVLGDSYPIAQLEGVYENHTCMGDDCDDFENELVATGCWGPDGSAAFNAWANAIGAICAISVSGGDNFAQLQSLGADGYQITGKGVLSCGNADNIKWGLPRPDNYGEVAFQLIYDSIPEYALGNGSSGPYIVELLGDNGMAKGTFLGMNGATSVISEALDGDCSDPDAASTCGDAGIFVVGTQAQFSNSTDVAALFGQIDGGPGDGEAANYIAGWLCPDNGGTCSTRENFPGTDKAPAFDINGVWAGDCELSREEVCTAPGGCGDPHFVGFDGQAFDYTGLPGSSFSVISTPTVQVNAALVPETVNGLTYMGAVGVLTPAGRIAVTAHPETTSVLVEANDVVLALGDAAKVYDLGSGVSVSYLDAKTVRVSVSDVMSFTVSLRHDQFLDIPQVALSMTPSADNIHGVLGQTAVPNRAFGGFEGQEEEYIVSSLFSVDSAHNRFEADTGVRQMASVVPLLQVEPASGSVLMASATNSDM